MGFITDDQVPATVGRAQFGLEGFGTYTLTPEGEADPWEYWAEAVTIWVYKGEYSAAQLGQASSPGEPNQIGYIEGVFRK